MTPTDLVLVDRTDATATITLNRPDARNALSRELDRQLRDRIIEADDDPEISVILLAGAGGAFCAGVDLKELAATGFTGDDRTENCIDRVAACTTPVIGLVDGPAVTGGFELALACDFLIASPTARFADTHSRVGIVPGGGLTARLADTVGIRRARQLSATGQYIDAPTALAWGLVNEVVESAELLTRGIQIATTFAAAESRTLRAVWSLYDGMSADAIADGVARERATNAQWSAAMEAVAEAGAAVIEHGRAQNRER